MPAASGVSRSLIVSATAKIHSAQTRDDTRPIQVDTVVVYAAQISPSSSLYGSLQGMQQWSTKPEEACNCYPSRSPHLVDGIQTLIVPCAQWQQQLPLVECPLSALLRAFGPATRGITRDEQCSLPHIRSSVWHLRRNLLFHLST